jgi:hypothetical protein
MKTEKAIFTKTLHALQIAEAVDRYPKSPWGDIIFGIDGDSAARWILDHIGVYMLTDDAEREIIRAGAGRWLKETLPRGRYDLYAPTVADWVKLIHIADATAYDINPEEV